MNCTIAGILSQLGDLLEHACEAKYTYISKYGHNRIDNIAESL